MKKKTLITWIIVLLCLVGLIVLLQQCNHEDLTTFKMADVSEITFEELLSSPYVTMDQWSFVDLWTVRCGGQSADASIAEMGSAEKIGVDLRELLKGVTLHTYAPEEKVRNYDTHVKELLWERNDCHTYLQLVAACDPNTPLNDDDLTLHMLHLYILDASQGYLTISYRTGAEPESKAYVFSINDPVTISQLVSYAGKIISQSPTEPDPTEPFKEGNIAMPPSVFINDKLYVSADYPSGYSEISKECVCLGEITECVGATNVPEKNFQTNYSPVGTKVYQYYSVILLEEGGKYYAYTEVPEEPNFFAYDETLEAYLVDFRDTEGTGEVGKASITMTDEEKQILLDLLEPYGDILTSNVLKCDYLRYYSIEIDDRMTLTIDPELGNYGENGEDLYFGKAKKPFNFASGWHTQLSTGVLVFTVGLFLTKQFETLLLILGLVVVLLTMAFVIARLRPDAVIHQIIQIVVAVFLMIAILVVPITMFAADETVDVETAQIPLYYDDIDGEAGRLEKAAFHQRSSIFGSAMNCWLEHEEDTVTYYVYKSDHPWVIDKIWKEQVIDNYHLTEENVTDLWNAELAYKTGSNRHSVKYSNAVLIISFANDMVITSEKVDTICAALLESR